MCVYRCPVWKEKCVLYIHTDMMMVIYHWQVLPEAFIKGVMAWLWVAQ